MIHLPYVSPSDFFELVEYTKITKMCTNPYCTTCGAHEFRKLCRQVIGKENMIAILNTVTEEVVEKHWDGEWMDPLSIIIREFGFGSELKRDNPLLRTHYDNLREERMYRREEYLKSQQEELNKYLYEKTKKEAKRQTYRANCGRSKAERNSILKHLEDLSLEQKLLQIAEDVMHLPNFYPIDLSTITVEVLETFSKETLRRIHLGFSRFKKKEWRKFYESLGLAIHESTTKNERERQHEREENFY